MTQLKGSAQWEWWFIELNATLNANIGSTGISLSYVIRINTTPDPIGTPEHTNWERKVMAITTIPSPECRIDSRIVRQILSRNISEDSDVYTYVKREIKNDARKIDITALR